jgi:hypothetical protein
MPKNRAFEKRQQVKPKAEVVQVSPRLDHVKYKCQTIGEIGEVNIGMQTRPGSHPTSLKTLIVCDYAGPPMITEATLRKIHAYFSLRFEILTEEPDNKSYYLDIRKMTESEEFVGQFIVTRGQISRQGQCHYTDFVVVPQESDVFQHNDWLLDGLEPEVVLGGEEYRNPNPGGFIGRPVPIKSESEGRRKTTKRPGSSRIVNVPIKTGPITVEHPK